MKRLTDPSFAAGVREVRLHGFLERQDGTSRLSLDEHAVWPDRYERKVTEAGGISWLRLEADQILAGAASGQPKDSLPPSLVRLRLRSLFVLRHLANAVARGTAPQPFDRKGEKLQALDVRDGYGPFRVLVGGLAGGLQGVQEGSDAVYFTAQVRSGPWMYPASQAAVTNDRLLEVVRVTSTETTPQGP